MTNSNAILLVHKNIKSQINYVKQLRTLCLRSNREKGHSVLQNNKLRNEEVLVVDRAQRSKCACQSEIVHTYNI